MMNNMDMERLSPQERIITAAINCMDKEGIQSVTIRSIAQEAGVNSAAINYYFRSKGNLIREALRYSLAQAFEDLPNFASAEDSGGPIDIAELFRHFLQGVLRYPGLARAHLYDALMHNDYSGLFVKGFNDFLRKLLERVRSRFPKDGQAEPELRLIAAFSAIILFGLMPGGFRKFSGVDLADPRMQDRYIELLSRQFLAGFDGPAGTKS